MEAVMLDVISRRAAIIAICLSAILAGCATKATTEDTHAAVSEAQATLVNFQKDPEMTWFRENVRKARAIVISPRIWKAGFIVGGSGGPALALARTDGKQQWAGPAFYKIGAGTVGFQAGVEKSEMVALVMTEKALNALLSASFKLGADLSIAVGPIGAGAAAPINADMVVFSRSKGLYGGVNFEGSVFSLDDRANEAFYGRPATSVDILIKRSVSNPNAMPLLKSVAAIAG
jgi:lipid-binding SYLF domain-containing protein